MAIVGLLGCAEQDPLFIEPGTGGSASVGMTTASDGPSVGTGSAETATGADSVGTAGGNTGTGASGAATTDGATGSAGSGATASSASGSASSGSTGSTGGSTSGTTGGSIEICNGTDDDNDGLVDEVSASNTSCNGCALEQFQGSAYWFCGSDPGAWGVARDACLGLGTNLVSIHDTAADTFLLGHLTSRGGSFSDEFWIGANDLAMEGVFEWADGTPWDLEAWAPREPNDYNSVEDCVSMEAADGWNDIECAKVKVYVCRSTHAG